MESPSTKIGRINVRNPQYRMRVVKARKGKGSFKRVKGSLLDQ